VFGTAGEPVRFYQTVTHYGMIENYHPSIRHRGKNAPFGLPRRKGSLSRTLSLKILKAKDFPFPALRFSTARFTLLYLRATFSRCITGVSPLEHSSGEIPRLL